MIRSGLIYFSAVFGAGFVLGAIRTMWIVPWIGARRAELSELPLMLLVIGLSARAVVRRNPGLRTEGRWFGVGLISLALLLAMEFGVMLRMRGLSLSEYWTGRDPVSSTAFFLALAVFAAAPALEFRRTRSKRAP